MSGDLIDYVILKLATLLTGIVDAVIGGGGTLH